MAALSSARIYGLIDRFLCVRQRARYAPVDMFKVEYAAIRTLAETPPLTPLKADNAWLERTELRDAQGVVGLLENSEFRDQPGKVVALFLDNRCGLIRLQHVGSATEITAKLAVADILRSASDCHAAGMVLATHDPGAQNVRAPHYQKMTRDLQDKGDAVEIYLLDHFVLTGAGWRRFLSPYQNGCA